MDARTLLRYASQYAPRVFQISRKTWYFIGGGFLLLSALLVWALIASAQWLFHQGRDAASGIVDSAPQLSEVVMGQVENVAPGAKEMLNGVLGGFTLKQAEKPEQSEPLEQREVSGTDIAPVERFTGLTRTSWDKSGMVQYEGKAAFQQVRDHYSSNLTQQGFTEAIVAATQEVETNEYTKGQERYVITTTQKTAGVIHVKIEKLGV